MTDAPGSFDDSVALRLDRLIEGLSGQERRAAVYLRANYPVAGLEPLSRAAGAAGTSPQTMLRVVGKLGFPGYRALQDRLRDELAASSQTPLGRLAAARSRPADEDWLSAFGRTVARNTTAAFEGIVRAEFEAAARLVGDRQRRVLVIGGRFTQGIARLLVRQLTVVRGDVEEIGSLTATWADRLIDVGRRTTVVAYDVRRYQPDVMRFAAAAAGQGAAVVLLTDSPGAPAARHARHTLVAPVESLGAWDSLSALLAISEALVARATEAIGDEAAGRLARLERLRAQMDGG
jgi:DNA-binding MurR/RpiR family transcriptional regulator